MNGYASVSQYIYIFALAAQWLRHWPLITEVAGSSPVIGKDFPNIILFSFRIHDNKLFDMTV